MKKRILALVMAVTMTLGMSMTAMAASNVSVKDSTDKYAAYKVFEGEFTLVDSGKKDTDGTTIYDNKFAEDAVKWAEGIDHSELGDAVEEANKILNFTVDELEAYARTLGSKITTVKAGESEDGSSTIVGLEQGYYLLVNETKDASATDRYKLVYVDGKNDVELAPKKEGVTFNKKLNDINDSNGDALILKDSADHDFGDTVRYTLTGALPANYQDMNEYTYEFHDTMDKGLELQEGSIQVFYTTTPEDPQVGEKLDVAANKITVVKEDNGKTSFTVDLSSLTSYIPKDAYKENKKVVVTFDAKLTEDAVIGSAGNWNEAWTVTGDGETPHDRVVVFTYQVEVNKVNENNESLEGAHFALYKKYTVNAPEDASTLDVDAAKDGAIFTIPSGLDSTEAASYYLVEEITVDDTATFTFKGVDDGDYVLVETQVPAKDVYGNDATYGVIEPIVFTIAATHDLEADEPVLRELTATKADGSTTAFNTSLTDGKVSTTVQNRPTSTVLPSTGGIGTTIFYVIGGLLVVGAGVVLFTRRKMATEE